MVGYCRKLGMRVGDRTRINASVNIGTEPFLISIGDHCEVTGCVNLLTHDGGVWVFRDEHPYWEVMGRIELEDNVYIGYGATIMPNVRIGKNSVIAAGAIVTRNIPPNSVAAGVPARVIKSISDYKDKCARTAIETKRYSGKEKMKKLLDLVSPPQP